MANNLLIENQLIDQADRMEIQKELDAAFKSTLESKNPVIKFINAFFMHPAGVIVNIWLYSIGRAKIRQLNRANEMMSLDEEFKLAMKTKIMNELKETL